MTEHTAAVPVVPPVPTSLEQRVAEAIDNVTFGYGGEKRPVDELDALTVEVIALCREQIARDIEAERDRLRQPPFPADAQWLRALESAANIARAGVS